MVKVSVVIPVYNNEKYLEQCLQSVVNQTLKDIEIICIDDGSRDNSTNILQKYEKSYRNFFVFQQENQGAGYARNQGIVRAKGEFVCFMDGDDYYPEQDVLESLYEAAVQNGVSISGGTLCYSDGNNNALTFFEEKIMEYYSYQCSFGFTRFLYRLELLKSKNIYFPSYRRCQDQPFLVKAMICAKRFYSMRKNVYSYRVRYKKIKFTLELTVDALRGFIDILQLSANNKLSKLHEETLAAIDSQCLVPLFKYVAEGREEGINVLHLLQTAVDKNLISTENKDKYNRLFLEVNEIKGIVMQAREKERKTLEKLQKAEVFIYGSGKTARLIAKYILSHKEMKIESFLVSPGKIHPKSIFNIPVNEISEVIPKQSLIWIATLNHVRAEIEKKLRKEKYENLISIDYEILRLFSMRGENTGLVHSMDLYAL